MKRLILIASAALTLIPGPAVSEVAASDWVLAQWRGGAHYYPATVLKTDGTSVTLEYDDGARETRPATQVKGYDWQTGTVVECRWHDGGWYGATITTIGDDATTLHILYDDGAKQLTKTKRCRSL